LFFAVKTTDQGVYPMSSKKKGPKAQEQHRIHLNLTIWWGH